MSNLWNADQSLLLAQYEREIGYYTKNSAQFSNYWYLLLVPLAIGVIWWLLPQVEKIINPAPPARKGDAPSADLFSTLCQAHGLKANEVNLLTTIAGLLNLKNPALLFVDPYHFSKFISSRQDSEGYEALRNKLFGREVSQEMDESNTAGAAMRTNFLQPG